MLDEGLFRQLKKEAVSRGQTLKELVDTLLRRALGTAPTRKAYRLNWKSNFSISPGTSAVVFAGHGNAVRASIAPMAVPFAPISAGSFGRCLKQARSLAQRGLQKKLDTGTCLMFWCSTGC